jgi:hypothetical protein
MAGFWFGIALMLTIALVFAVMIIMRLVQELETNPNRRMKLLGDVAKEQIDEAKERYLTVMEELRSRNGQGKVGNRQ